MGEYISKEIALKELSRNSITKKITFADGVSIFDTIKNIPTADVAEVKHGEWEKDIWKIRGDGEIYDYRCSICKGMAHKSEYGNNDIFAKFCHHCGAKMDGERKDK